VTTYLSKLRVRGLGSSEDGVMLIEMVVSVLLLAVAMSMTVIIVSVLTKNVANTANTGVSTDAAQTAVTTLASYVQGAVSPVGAFDAYPGTPIASTCWGISNSSSYEGSSANGWPVSTEPELNQTTGIIYAHDYDLEFCGYGADASGSSNQTPNVYEIYVSNVGCTANNYCPVDVVSYGNSSYSTNDYAAHAGTLVASIGRVWCDKACQQLGISCASINDALAEGLGTAQLPSNYATLCPPGYSGSPPLFNYYTSTGTTGNVDPLNWVNAYTNSASIPANVNVPTTSPGNCVATASPTFNVASCGPLDMYSPNDEQAIQYIQSIVLNMTVLGQDNPSNTSAKITSVQIEDQVWLRNLSE
jgi:hypothetical protein